MGDVVRMYGGKKSRKSTFWKCDGRKGLKGKMVRGCCSTGRGKGGRGGRKKRGKLGGGGSLKKIA